MKYYEESLPTPLKLNLLPGDELKIRSGSYFIENDLGSGGFGSVYHIANSQGREYALKVLQLWTVPNAREREEIGTRFLREFESGRINSPYIVTSHFYGHLSGNPYIIMEYCSGGSLQERMNLFQEESRFRHLATEVLRGLRDLHAEGIIHRDLKPGNILLDGKKNIRLTDFGISGYLNNRMTQPDRQGFVQQLWGSIAYTPPEQLNHEQAFRLLGPVTDVFGFGVTAYQVLSDGHHPFGSFTDFADNRSVFYERVKNGRWDNIRTYRKDVSDHWVAILKACLHPHPEKRLPDPEAVLEMIEKGTRATPTTRKTVEMETVRPGAAKEVLPQTWRLKVMAGDIAGTCFDLGALMKEKQRNYLTIGRLNDQNPFRSDINIEDKYNLYISTRHATLEYMNERWYIRDGQWIRKEGKSGWVRSTNGTAINYNYIDSTKRTLLKVGDIISVGETTLKVERG